MIMPHCYVIAFRTSTRVYCCKHRNYDHDSWNFRWSFGDQSSLSAGHGSKVRCI